MLIALLGLVLSATLSTTLIRIMTAGFKSVRSVANLGKIEDIRNDLFRIQKIDCPRTLYQPNTTTLINACSSGTGYIPVYLSNSTLVIDAPRPTASAASPILYSPSTDNSYQHTQISGFLFRASCPSGNRLSIEYKDPLASNIGWKELFDRNHRFCPDIFGNSSAPTSCNSGQYLAGFKADGSLNCLAFPHCPAGTVMLGFNPNGSPDCKATKKLYRCVYLGGGQQDIFISTDPNCEGRASQGNLFDGF